MPTKLEMLVESCSLAFWAELVPKFPQVTTGDFPPDATIELHEAMKKAIIVWLNANTSKEEIVRVFGDDEAARIVFE